MDKPVRQVRLHSITPNLRLMYANEVIEELCTSLRRHGQLEPILLHLHGESFRILDGEKRWRACKRLGMARVKAVILE